MGRRKISTTVYVTPEQNRQLKALNQRTKVPVAEYIRQGIDLILARHAAGGSATNAAPLRAPCTDTDRPMTD